MKIALVAGGQLTSKIPYSRPGMDHAKSIQGQIHSGMRTAIKLLEKVGE